MNNTIAIKHRIQKHILETLTYKEMAHFSELRPARVDTNVFSYHLKSLLGSGLITKQDKDYGLSPEGLVYVDHESNEKQPKVMIMLLVQDSDGRVLLSLRDKQPYINTWTLPYGYVQADDLSIDAAAKRLTNQLLGLEDVAVRHVGDGYIRVFADRTTISTTLVHVFRFETDKVFMNNPPMWLSPIKLDRYPLAPAVDQIIARSFFGDAHFFAEFEHEWSTVTS